MERILWSGLPNELVSHIFAKLMFELYAILDTAEIDLIGMKDSLIAEIERFYKIQAFLDGTENIDRSKDKKEYDLRKYAKTIFEEGRIDERRQILKNLKGRLILKNKKIYIDKLPEGTQVRDHVNIFSYNKSMEMPNVKEGDIIKIGDHFCAPKAQVVRIYITEEKNSGLCGDVEVVYWQNKLKGIKEDVIWSGENWEFKTKGPSGSYVDIDHYDPRLKN